MPAGPFEFDLRRLIREYETTELPPGLAEDIELLPLRYPKSRASRRDTRWAHLTQIAAAAVVAVAAIVGLGVYSGSIGTSPKSLPAGEPLKIITEPDPPQSDVCFDARISALMTRTGSEIVFDTGYLPITWPYGTKAILVDGKAELFSSDGTLIGTEGQRLENLQGGALPDGRFHVCAFGGR